MKLIDIANQVDELMLEVNGEIPLLDYEVDLRLAEIINQIPENPLWYYNAARLILSVPLPLRNRWKTINNLATIELIME